MIATVDRGRLTLRLHLCAGPALRKYYFDFLHNNTLTRDDEGSEHPTDDAARHEMRLAMLEISRGAARFEEPWQLVGILRDGGRDIWRGRLSFDGTAPGESNRV